MLLKMFLREFFQLFFPAWVDQFDWAHVTWLEQEAFLNPPRGERRQLDLVAHIPLIKPLQIHPHGPEATVVLIHVEIESADSVTAFRPRMFEYFTWLRSRHEVPVLPVGLYLRVGRDGIGWDGYEESLWGESLVQFRYPYVGLSALDAMLYLEGDNLLGVALSALMRIPADSIARFKADAMQRLATAEVDAARRFLLCECVDAYLPLEGSRLDEYDRLLLSEKYREANMVGKTNYERGFEKGQNEAETAFLAKLLVTRFGPLPEHAHQRLQEMSHEQREQLALKLLKAGSLAELGLGDSSAVPG